jgi:hypothetical protein
MLRNDCVFDEAPQGTRRCPGMTAYLTRYPEEAGVIPECRCEDPFGAH